VLVTHKAFSQHKAVCQLSGFFEVLPYPSPATEMDSGTSSRKSTKSCREGDIINEVPAKKPRILTDADKLEYISKHVMDAIS
jgi:hypothetical protein